MDEQELYPAVDFVTNVFERTYRDVLHPGAIHARTSGHLFPFNKIVVLVNNVNDRADVERMLAPLMASGEINEFHYVADHLDRTLERAALTRANIQKTIHYTDCSLVAVFLSGSPYLLYSDADVFMDEPADWIRPSLKLMQADPRIAVANPNWHGPQLAEEAREMQGEFGLGYCFSDQLYLVKREEFAKPIYKQWVPIGWRYPMANITPIFEQRVDMYMRRNKRLRATYIHARYDHTAEEGVTRPAGPVSARVKRFLMDWAVRICRKLPTKDPRVSI